MTVQQSMFALLVGINKYAQSYIPNLGGCVGDVEALDQLLRERFREADLQILSLVDEAATHRGIKDAFSSHLIDNVRRARNQGGDAEPPCVLFYYSGHGSRARDDSGQSVDGHDETIVPHDSRTPGVFDIKDWELGMLLDELGAYTDNVTVILDCCHSGSGTRDLAPFGLTARQCQPDLRPQPTERPPALASTRSASTNSRWSIGERYVLLAGCRAHEKSYERSFQRGGHFHQEGVFTHFLLRELTKASPLRPLTYRELHERVSHQVTRLYQRQHPQCEGDRDRLLFGGLRPARDRLHTVVAVGDGHLVVDGGRAHGLTEGSLLHAFPPSTRTVASETEPLATLRVIAADVVSSRCTGEGPPTAIPLHARVRLHQQSVDLRRKVNVEALAPAIRRKLAQHLSHPEIQPYISLASVDADFYIEQTRKALHILDRGALPLTPPYADDALDEVARAAAHLARFKNAEGLGHDKAAPALAGGVQLRIKRLGFDPASGEARALPTDADERGMPLVQTGEAVVLELTNSGDEPLYVTVLEFGYDWSITRLYPRLRGMQKALQPGRRLQLGCSRSRRDQLQLGLPEGIDEVVELIKVIATRSEHDLEVLEMGALGTSNAVRRASRNAFGSSLGALLNMAVGGTTRGAIMVNAPGAEEDWTTAQVQFRLIRKADKAPL